VSGGRIVSVGARAALGLHALQVALGMRAGLFEPRASRLSDARGRAIGCCRVGGLGADLHGAARLLALAEPALREASAGQDLSDVALIVALPIPERADGAPQMDELGAELATRLGAPFASVQVIRQGHTGGLAALVIAHKLLRDGCPGVLVGGVDSYYHPDVLASLDGELRLHALGIDDGFVPGEGAAFMMLRPQASPDDLAHVVAMRLASEPAMLDEERPNIAEGLSEAIRGTDGTDARWVMTDVNAEHRRTREWTLVATRHRLTAGEVSRPCSELGDLGAATVPMMAAIACGWWRHGCAPNREVLLLASSSDDRRGAALLRAPAEGDT
jgi:3-oxoacyl-[acyl-carrier-protein] synthase I